MNAKNILLSLMALPLFVFSQITNEEANSEIILQECNEKEREIKNLMPVSSKKSYMVYNGVNYKIYNNLINNSWKETTMSNLGEISAGVDSPFKVTQIKCKKIVGFLDSTDGVETGAWTEFFSNVAEPYIGHKSTRTSSPDDTLVFDAYFGGDVDLYYVSDTDGGIINIQIDSLPIVVLDTYSTTANNYKQIQRISEDLKYGHHAITITNTGTKNSLSSGYQCWINAIKITGEDVTPDSGLIKLKDWKALKQVNKYDERTGVNGRVYVAQSTGLSGTTIPSHSSGVESDGSIDWLIIAETSYDANEFLISNYGSEFEYAYEMRINDDLPVYDVGGNLHGNEFLSSDVNVYLDGVKTTIQKNTYYGAYNIRVEQQITDYANAYASKTDIANVVQNHIFNNEVMVVDHSLETIVDFKIGYHYTAMFPFLTYEGGLGARKTFSKLSSTNRSYNLIDYELNDMNPILGNEKTYIAWADGEAFVPKGTGGVPSLERGEGSLLIGLKTNSKSLNNFNDSTANCGLALNSSNGQYTGYSSWLSKMYFQRTKGGQVVDISSGTVINTSSSYYVKIY